MIDIVAAPAGSGLPDRHGTIALPGGAMLPIPGTPILVLHGPIPMRAVLGLTPDLLLVRPLAPLMPTVRLQRSDISTIDTEDGHWYEFTSRVVHIQRHKGPGVRMMAPVIPGLAEGTENLGRLLRAWWYYGRR